LTRRVFTGDALIGGSPSSGVMRTDLGTPLVGVVMRVLLVVVDAMSAVLPCQADDCAS
jgi:hypothetical protein